MKFAVSTEITDEIGFLNVGLEFPLTTVRNKSKG